MSSPEPGLSLLFALCEIGSLQKSTTIRSMNQTNTEDASIEEQKPHEQHKKATQDQKKRNAHTGAVIVMGLAVEFRKGQKEKKYN